MNDIPELAVAEVERLVTFEWCEMLGLNSVGRNENFFDLGGDSLLLFALHIQLEDVLHRKIELLDMVRFPTVSSFVMAICRPRSVAAPDQFTERADKRRNELYARALRRRALNFERIRSGYVREKPER
jgi:hypothetical protein